MIVDLGEPVPRAGRNNHNVAGFEVIGTPFLMSDPLFPGPLNSRRCATSPAAADDS